MSNEEVILTEKRKKKEKKQKLTKEEKKAKKELRKKEKQENPENYYRFRRLFFGVGKESLRISWLKKNKILYYSLIVFFSLILLALIFSAIAIVAVKFIP